MRLLNLNNSSNIASARYDDSTGELEVTFTARGGAKGKTYNYQGVPRNVVDGFVSAESPGKYFYSEIRGKFGWQ